MREWFEGLESREQISVAVAGIFVIFALLYFAVWLPLASSEATLSNSVQTWERSLAELRPLKAAVQSGGNGNTRPVSNQSLVVVVDSSLAQFSLSNAHQRSQPTSPNGIRVEFENAAFDDLVRWLGNVSANHGLQVQSSNFSASSQGIAGRVNASVTLER